MSKKHLEEQKLLIENFNKWVNEEQQLQEEELDEILGIGAAGVAALGAKFVATLYALLRAYNDLSKISDEIMSSPDAPKQLKDAAAGATNAGGDISDAAGSIAKDMPLGVKLTQKAINALAKKHFGIDIDVGKIELPKINQDQPEPEDESEPEDEESRKKLGLMSKDKEERLKQLRDKYRE